METAVIAGLAIVAIFAIHSSNLNAVSASTGGPVLDSYNPTSGAAGGAAIQTIQQQPGSTAGQAGSGSMDPSGAKPPLLTSPRPAPPTPPRLPVNIAPVPRFATTGFTNIPRATSGGYLSGVKPSGGSRRFTFSE